MAQASNPSATSNTVRFYPSLNTPLGLLPLSHSHPTGCSLDGHACHLRDGQACLDRRTCLSLRTYLSFLDGHAHLDRHPSPYSTQSQPFLKMIHDAFMRKHMLYPVLVLSFQTPSVQTLSIPPATVSLSMCPPDRGTIHPSVGPIMALSIDSSIPPITTLSIHPSP